ncbi:MAG: cell division protein FtsZ [Bacteroidales bacterium]|nr:cell division protein FtsZ [Bacteroidales bacterium]
MFRPMYEKPANYIKVIGVGGGGGNAVNHMLQEGIQGVDFVLCNTDYQALMRSTVPTKIHLGKRQLGAGNDPAVGREAALSSEEEIDKVLDENTQMAFVTAGMGGGTGTGAAPVVARIAKDKGILTVGIVTIPFECEGRRRKQQAQAGIEELRKHVDTLIVISSDKLRDTYGNMKLTDAFKKADDVLATAAKGIAEIITVTGYVNVDFEDVKTVMRDSGKAIMGTGRAKGENRAEEAIKLAINSPLLNDNNIDGAKNILIYITSGSDEVSLDEVVEITEYAQSICGNCSDVIWGNGVDESLGEDISVTLIATGFDNQRSTRTIPATQAKNKLENIQQGPVVCTPVTPCDSEKRTVHRLDEEEKKPEAVVTPTAEPTPAEPLPEDEDDDTPHAVIHTLNEKPEAKTTETSFFKPEQTASTPTVKVFDNPFAGGNNEDESFEISNMAEIHTTQAAAVETETLVLEEPKEKPYDPKEELKRNRLRALSLNFKTQKGLEELEREPAYMRRNRDFEELPFEDEVSEYSASSQGISTENSYLHQRVD